ncbi:Yip1 domain-containing protein [Seinonella peptonophila]|uniref:Yip1 domain-containing protein n=1 Tax=Seinonella peptonophila TaxID=112248 RepID=A0A1M4ZN89_9BACL|nr:YIP1 family protein [Seinonella peptonophila]SHF19503.1 Yip1 domain-containing protein [Seinonella peptonophila]
MKKPSLLGMIWRPQTELSRLYEQPTLWMPLFIICVLHSLAIFFGTRIKTTEWIPGNSTPVSISYTYMPIGSLMVDLISYLVSLLVMTSILYGISKISKKAVSYKQVLSLSIYLQAIPVLASVLKALTHFFERGEQLVSYSFQSLFHVSPSHLAYVLGSITIFTIWNWILSAWGYQKVLGFSRPISWIWAILLWYLPFLIGNLIGFPQV